MPSQRGPNVMFNLRELTLLEALWTQPGRMVQAMLTLGYLKLSGALKFLMYNKNKYWDLFYRHSMVFIIVCEVHNTEYTFV